MNQAQRNYLIKKIEESAKTRIDTLKSSKPEHPNLNNWLLHKVLSNEFELRTIDEIRDHIRKRALNAKGGGENWIGVDKWSSSLREVKFAVGDIFVLPSEYKEEAEICRKKEKEIDEEIHRIATERDTLITRIQLASDKTLQAMINEVDDMGNISLMDEKLRFLTSGAESKLLTN